MAGGAMGRRQGSGSAAMLVLLGPIAVLLLVSCGCGVAAGKEFTVGDDFGWNIPSHPDFYADWAAKYQFAVGDSIRFLYVDGAHTVQPLPSKESFKICNTTAGVKPPFTGGDNVITLSTPGTKWYICSVAGHCLLSMKVKIDVSPALAPTPGASLPPLVPEVETVNNTATARVAGLVGTAAAVVVAGALFLSLI